MIMETYHLHLTSQNVFNYMSEKHQNIRDEQIKLENIYDYQEALEHIVISLS